MEEIFVDDIARNKINKDYISSIYDGKNFEISFLFKSDFKNAKYLRDHLIIILDVLGVDITWKNRFVLIIDELSNNAIEYGSKPGSLNKIRFISEKNGNEMYINIEVEDAGNGEKAKTASKMNELKIEKLKIGFTNHKSIRGRGLFMIIVKLVDKLYFNDSKDGGLIVGISKKITLKFI